MAPEQILAWAAVPSRLQVDLSDPPGWTGPLTFDGQTYQLEVGILLNTEDLDLEPPGPPWMIQVTIILDGFEVPLLTAMHFGSLLGLGDSLIIAEDADRQGTLSLLAPYQGLGVGEWVEA